MLKRSIQERIRYMEERQLTLERFQWVTNGQNQKRKERMKVECL